MLIRPSYALSEQARFYSKPELRQIDELEKRDICNSFYFRTSNHCRAHVDAPRHLCGEGMGIAEYSSSELIFTRQALLEIPLADNESIEPPPLGPLLAALDETRI